LILGDNIFFGHGCPTKLRAAAELTEGALIFAYPVRDPQRYGVVAFNQEGNVTSIEEKPEKPRSNFAVPGIYFYDNNVVSIAENLKPSPRCELEITDLHLEYLARKQLKVEVLGRGIAWLDSGTHESLMQAANFIQAVQERQGLMISCPEESAYRMEYIDRDQLKALAEDMGENQYRQYLQQMVLDDPFSDVTRNQ
jgi:glucose-1-phosphate thymidylyltransferase